MERHPHWKAVPRRPFTRMDLFSVEILLAMRAEMEAEVATIQPEFQKLAAARNGLRMVASELELRQPKD